MSIDNTHLVGIELARYDLATKTSEKLTLINCGESVISFADKETVTYYDTALDAQLAMRQLVWDLMCDGWCVSDAPRQASLPLPESEILAGATEILAPSYQAASGTNDVDLGSSAAMLLAALDAELQSVHFNRTGRQAPRFPRIDGTDTTSSAPSAQVNSDDYDGEAYLRPNGQKYFPQIIDGTPDVELLRKCADMKFHVMLWGAPGCGKTALVEAAYPDCVTVIGEIGMTSDDLVGGWRPVSGSPNEFHWVDGPAVIAAQAGVPLFVDELAIIDPAVLLKLYPAMDDRRMLYIDGRPDGPVRCEDGFIVVGAFNPFVPGARVSEAMWSRMVVKIDYRTDFGLAYRLGVDKKVIDVAVAMDDQLRQATSTTGWAPQMRELLRYRDLADQFGKTFALRALVGEAPIEVQANVAAMFATAFGQANVEPLATSVTARNLF